MALIVKTMQVHENAIQTMKQYKLEVKKDSLYIVVICNTCKIKTK